MASKFKTKSEIASEFIQEQILSNNITSGTQITTKSISDSIGMSETPVREAIKSLAAEGWLRHTAHHGTVVASPNTAQIEEIFLLRGLLNSQAILLGRSHFNIERLAQINENIEASKKAVAENDYESYSRLNRDFHELLCNTPDSEWTYKLFSILQSQSGVFRHGFRAIPDGLYKSLDAHMAIRAALTDGDVEAAAELAHEDEVSSGKRLIDNLSIVDGQDNS